MPGTIFRSQREPGMCEVGPVRHMAYARVSDFTLMVLAAKLYPRVRPNCFRSFQMRVSHRLPFILIIVVLLIVTLPACSTQADRGDVTMTPMDRMPEQVKSAPVSVQQAYQFASANPQLMQDIPCYCGCGQVGHTSNYSCYVSGQDGNGALSFDSHALGCSLCVDITQDSMRLLQQGKSPGEIRAYVDSKYLKFGPSNIQ